MLALSAWTVALQVATAVHVGAVTPEPEGATTCSCKGALPPGHVAVPCLCIPACESGNKARVGDFTYFNQSGTGKLNPTPPGLQATSAAVCHTPAGLELEWAVVDANIVSNNCGAGHNETCNKCRDQVWQGDAVEFYFTDNLADTHQNVTEIDISPLAGGIWTAHINNTDGYVPDSPPVPIDCASIKVAHTPMKAPDGWAADASIPWAALTSKHHTKLPTFWRVQFYRWDYGVGSAPRTTGYPSAWNVPYCDGRQMGGRCNVEHTPKYFGVAKLV